MLYPFGFQRRLYITFNPNFDLKCEGIFEIISY